MPRVKIEYIVSFSSEDPENPSSNLLSLEVSKKKWLCTRGEPSCSVVLQLSHAVKISAIQIGAYQAALVEVLVGLSEKPNDPFQVLVPSSVFLTPSESRRETNADRVRSFTGDQLTETVRDKRWDRLRVVCSQPYNKHCQYGLSFIHITAPEGVEPPAPAPSIPPSLILTSTTDSDDEFRPGELFAAHRSTPQSTDAQIRQATSQIFKNISEESTKLIKTPISKARPKPLHTEDERAPDRNRDSVMYTDDDDKPHGKIDRIVNRHKDDRTRYDKAKEDKIKDCKHDKDSKQHRKVDEDSQREAKDVTKERREKDRLSTSESAKKRDDRKRDDSSNRKAAKDDAPVTPQSSKRDRNESSSQRKTKDTGDRKKHDDKSKLLRAGPVTDSPHTLLRGVVFVLSGYENPRRARVRDAALAMGARYERDWTTQCTHLICAFPNTPKLKAVRASANGASAAVCTASWIEQCCERRRRLPWQWYATETKFKVTPIDDDDEDQSRKTKQDDSECDTDDEIEKVMRGQKKPRLASPEPTSTSRDNQDKGKLPTPSPRKDANESRESDVAFVCDERIKGNVTIEESDGEDTDAESMGDIPEETIDESRSLPCFFEGYTFALHGVDDNTALLTRYVLAYGGLLIEEAQIDEDSEVDYWLCGRRGVKGELRGRCVCSDWVWRCHERRRLCPTTGYELTID